MSESDRSSTPPPRRLEEEEIERELARIPKWEKDVDSIHCTFEFRHFLEAIAFVNCVATLAEKYGHHPDIMVAHCRVKLSLTTQQAGGLTDLDISLAQKIDRMVEIDTGAE